MRRLRIIEIGKHNHSARLTIVVLSTASLKTDKLLNHYVTDCLVGGCREIIFVGKNSNRYVSDIFDRHFDSVKTSNIKLTSIDCEETENVVGTLLVALTSISSDDETDIDVGMLGPWDTESIQEQLSRSYVIATATK